jgi:alkaline phosphatase
MIGDGMGVAQVTAGRTFKGRLALERFRTAGLVLTQPRGKTYITDSAAGATALSTGVSTINGAVAVGPDSSSAVTVLEQAARRGRKTGIVVVCNITDATPACFVAHVPDRAMRAEIARQISVSETDLYFGSGWNWFVPRDRGGKREDGTDLLALMRQRGFACVTSDTAFWLLDLKKQRRVLGLFAEDNDGPAQERKPSLAARTKSALEFLAGPGTGFFLMVEGSQIDWAGHHNDSRQVMVEMADFDDAIAEAFRFAEANPGTLIVVTADHETGGYTLPGGSVQDKSVEGAFSTQHHTGTMVPLFATGPGSEEFGGIHTNAEIGRILLGLVK